VEKFVESIGKSPSGSEIRKNVKLQAQKLPE